MPVSIVLIVLNEESNIEDCLKTVQWADEIIVVDSGSQDNTVVKARHYTDKIYHNPFKDYSSQKNFGISQATKDWVFILDADERVNDELRAQIKNVTENPSLTAVYSVKRNTYLFGRLFRYTGTQDDYPIRLFPRGHAHFEQPVHERIVTTLPVLKISTPLIHYSTKNLKQYFSKLEFYLKFEVDFMHSQKRKTSYIDFIVRPIVKFFYLYLWKLGLLDGCQGFQFSLLSAYYDFRRFKDYHQSCSIKRAPA